MTREADSPPHTHPHPFHLQDIAQHQMRYHTFGARTCSHPGTLPHPLPGFCPHQFTLQPFKMKLRAQIKRCFYIVKCEGRPAVWKVLGVWQEKTTNRCFMVSRLQWWELIFYINPSYSCGLCWLITKECTTFNSYTERNSLLCDKNVSRCINNISNVPVHVSYCSTFNVDAKSIFTSNLPQCICVAKCKTSALTPIRKLISLHFIYIFKYAASV